jgi:hypothetical protein
MRSPLAQQDLGNNGPSSLARRQHLRAASGDPPNAAADMVFLSVATPHQGPRDRR